MDTEAPVRLVAGLTDTELQALDAKLQNFVKERPDVVGWTAREVAARLRLRVETVQRLLGRGEIQGVQVGGKVWRVHPQHLEDYLLNRRPRGRPRKPPTRAEDIPAPTRRRA
jgi:excisionase family DNA binding protein